MRQIIVEQGNEFKIKIRDIKGDTGAKDIFENDIFGDAYKQVASRVEEIVTATDRLDNKNEEEKLYGDYLNNIIAFSGERGQGKSSAMLSFTNYLEKLSNDTNKANDVFGDNTKKYRFVSIETIDPSTFEDMNNILEVVIARMYNNFEKKYKKDNTCVTKEKKNKIMGLFQKVYESLCLIRNPKKLEELEYDYEGSLQKIAHIGDSANLQTSIRKLVNAYLEIFVENNAKSFLIIPIDDLDINIKYAYRITEQIRKYLIIPNVIIIMAINIEQLKKCVEKEFREQLSVLITEEYRANKDEPINMAAKYVEKLIPDGRKISLPQIRAISQSGNDDIELKYYERETGKDLLKNKGSKGIEKTLLGYIFDKTGIAFIKPQNDVHNIIPNTLREVVNLLSVLGKMKDINSNKTIKLANVNIFEDYFLNTWIPSNLDDGHIRMIKGLYSENDYKKHRFICTNLMKIFETKDLYTVDYKMEGLFDNAKHDFIEKNKNYSLYSLGDVISWLDLLSNRYIDIETNNFVFALKTIYSITMNKMILIETAQTMYEPNGLYRFIGGDIWGYYLVYKNKFSIENIGYRREKVIRSEQRDSNNIKKELGRANFPYIINKVLGAEFEIAEIEARIKLANLNEEIMKKIANMTFCSKYYLEDKTNTNFISSNGMYRTNARLSIDEIFISIIDLDYLYVRSGFSTIEKMAKADNIEFTKLLDYTKAYIKNLQEEVNEDLIKTIATNIELSNYIQQYCEMDYGIKDRVESRKEYFTDFINTIEEGLGKIDYLSSLNQKIFREDEEFKNEITDLYSLCLESKPDGEIVESMVTSKEKNEIMSKRLKDKDEFESILKTIYNGKFDEVKEFKRRCPYGALRYKIFNLAKNISYYNKNDNATKKVIENLRKFYNEYSIKIATNDKKDIITDSIKEEFSKITKNIKDIIEVEKATVNAEEI